MLESTKAKKPKPGGWRYLKEMLTHPANVYTGLGAIAGAAVLSIPFGVGVAALPILGFVAGESIAALFVPSHPKFRARVDKKDREKARAEVREHLENEIRARTGTEARKDWSTYERMRERLASLEKVAAKRDTALTTHDLEKLDDVTLNYLSLWLARLVMSERRFAVDERELKKRLDTVNRQLDQPIEAGERSRLVKARDDLERMQTTRESLKAREAAHDATMLSLADAYEEVYQSIVTRPTNPEVGRQLQEAVDRMRFEENLEAEIDSEIGNIMSGPRVPARPAQKVG